MKSIVYLSFLPLMFFALSSCRSLPKEKYSQFTIDASYEVVDGDLVLKVNNVLHCPIRIYGSSPETRVDSILKNLNPLVIAESQDTVIRFNVGDGVDPEIRFRIKLGDSNKKSSQSPIAYPFPKGRSYKIVQGNNSRPTHNTNYSRYAIDFDLKINDTICSATDGYVVGVIEGYKFGGQSGKWRPYSNFITIYDPENGVLLQYVHLVHKGSFVEVGDEVKVGHPIGLSGKTGQTNIEHLHFNYLVPTENDDGIQSSPFEFLDGRKSTSFKRGDKVTW